MNWEAFGAIAEAIGAVGIIVTLVYLALQIRQNTVAQETSSVWLMTQIFNESHSLIMENSELAVLIDKTINNDELTSAEERRMFSLAMSMVNGYFAAWSAYKNGHLPADSYNAMVRDSNILTIGGFKRFRDQTLEGREPLFVKEFFGRDV